MGCLGGVGGWAGDGSEDVAFGAEEGPRRPESRRLRRLGLGLWTAESGFACSRASFSSSDSGVAVGCRGGFFFGEAAGFAGLAGGG